MLFNRKILNVEYDFKKVIQICKLFAEELICLINIGLKINLFEEKKKTSPNI